MGTTFWPGSAYEDDEHDERDVVYGLPDAPNATEPEDPEPADPGPGAGAGAGPVRGSEDTRRDTTGTGAGTIAGLDEEATPVRGVQVLAAGSAAAPVGVDHGSSAADLLASGPDAAQAIRAAPLTGWRKGVHVLTGGLVRPGPSLQARELAVDLAAVQVQLTGPRTVVVANPKGGGGKTPTVVGLSGTFGAHRGGRTLAWDNNETMGTLGIRTFSQQSATTAVDLLAALDHLAASGSRAGDIARFVRYQAAGGFDVLVSDENPQRMSQIDALGFRSLHNLLTTIYEVVVVDTGNNARASNFEAAIDVCDALVIPLAFKKDSVMSAGRLIDTLRSRGRGDLVARAVTVISGGPSTDQEAADLTRWRSFFAEQTAAVVEVPFDPHLAVGGPIGFGELAESTRRAYLRASARVAEVLSTPTGQPIR